MLQAAPYPKMQFNCDITADCACVSFPQQLKHTYRPSGWRIKQNPKEKKVINKSGP